MFGDVRAFQEMWGMFNVPFTGASDPVLFKDLDKLEVATPGCASFPCLYNQLAPLPFCNSGTACTATRQRRAPDQYFLSFCLSLPPPLPPLCRAFSASGGDL